MSAYVVSKSHIDAILTALNRFSGVVSCGNEPFYFYDKQSRRYSIATDIDEIGQILVNENVKSVKANYPKDTDATLPGPREKYWLTPYTFSRNDKIAHLGNNAKGALAAALTCYEYQSGDDPNYEHSAAMRFVQAARLAILRSLSGYADLWEIAS